MAEQDRSLWIAMLEAASANPQAVVDDDWKQLMDRLGLNYSTFPSVLQVIKEGRWRDARHPRAYVRKVVLTLERKLEAEENATAGGLLKPVQFRENIDDVESGLEHLLHLFDSSASGGFLSDDDGAWTEQGYDDYDPDDYIDESAEEGPRSHLSSYQRRLFAPLPDDLLEVHNPTESMKKANAELNAKRPYDVYMELKPQVRPNWRKWGERAGFDERELLVLTCMLIGGGRETLLAMQPDEESRKALQAAWKRVQRTGLDRLRAVLKK